MDISIGYNDMGFDMLYLYRRLELHMQDELAEDAREDGALPGVRFGHLDGAGGRLVTKRGLHELHFIEMPGIFQVDLLLAVRREYNLPSYKLDAVAQHFLVSLVLSHHATFHVQHALYPWTLT